MAAVKKTELYSSLWASCDELRGGMDASQYKDYILTLLFIKYVTDKFKDEPYASIVVPEGGSFDDMIAILDDPMKKKNIGEEMDKIIAKLAEANSDSFNLSGIIDNAHFNDEQKIGKGQEMVDKLVNLINIFRDDSLDFKNNKAEGDDIIGDAYEYLMRKFATESGKSKGQFYTPAEVSRVLAKVVGISKETNRSATVYDCACGSGSLLIRAVSEAKIPLSAYGQEKEGVTAGLAVMNTVLHNQPTTIIKAGNTFSDPQFFEDGDSDELKQFDYIVANPPFSLKNWRDGLKEYGRFAGYAEVPKKKGDYAWLLHIIKSLKPTGKAAVILPHGVLFRGATEGEIRKNLIDKGYIKGIIGLPANLFYGTGIAACIIVIDKEAAGLRDNIFMIDASRGFIKDGNKNRLREQDIYKIVNTFNNEIEDDPKYARKVPLSEIKNSKNNYNLNIPRYIENNDDKDPQDLAGHILGGIPSPEIAELDLFWTVFPKLKEKLFEEIRPKYYQLKVDKNEIASSILEDKDFKEYIAKSDNAFIDWENEVTEKLLSLDNTVNQKDLIVELYNKLLEKFSHLELVDKYDIYQVLLEYWNNSMADDVFLITREGYGIGKLIEKKYKKQSDEDIKKRKEKKLLSWDGVLLPKSILGQRYFLDDLKAIDALSTEISALESDLTEMNESIDEDSPLSDFVEKEEGKDTYKVEDQKIRDRIKEIRNSVNNEETKAIEESLRYGTYKVSKKQIEPYINENPLLSRCLINGKITSKSLNARLIEVRNALPINEEDKDEFEILSRYIKLLDSLKDAKDKQKEIEKDLDKKLEEKYQELSIEEIKELVVEEKWIATLQKGVNSLYHSLSRYLAGRISKLFNKYETTLETISSDIDNTQKELRSLLSELTVVGYENESEEEKIIDANQNNALKELFKLLSDDSDKNGEENE